MQAPRPAYWFVLLITFILGGCGPQTTPSPVVQTQGTPEFSAIDLAGPVMEVGSSHLYADGTLLMAVPGGPFIMGGQGPDNPEHQVNLSDFWIYSTKVTYQQYEYCVSMGQCTPPQFLAHSPDYGDSLHANDPMVGVNHEQAGAYCNFVHARLPTEAEWEKAARGPEGNIYPWGDDIPNCSLLNYDICVGSTTPVNTYPNGRSYYQAFDMEGNAFEWVSDKYQPDYYLVAPADDPQGPEKGIQHVVRSSAFNSGANQTQTYQRFHSRPDTVRDNLSFRCVVEDPTYFAPFCNYPATFGTDGIGGASSGKGVEVNCPELTIEQNPTCEGTTPVTNFDFTVDTSNLNEKLLGGYGITWTGGGCDKGTDHVLECTENGEVSLCGICQVKITTPPQCPAGYSYDVNAKSCAGKGSPGFCMPGYTATTSSAGSCCTLVGGTPAPTAMPLNLGSEYITNVIAIPNCPSGTFPIYDSSSNSVVCTPLPMDYPYCTTEGIVLNSCTPQGGGEEPPPQGCPVQSCETNYAWDPSSCSCVCDGC